MSITGIKKLVRGQFRGLILGLSLILLSSTPLYATVTFNWSGLPIEGERPDFLPSGSAAFEVNGSTLEILLTNNSAQQMLAIGEVLIGLTWNITGSGVSLTPLTAVIASGSRLVNPPADDPDPSGYMNATDLSSEWAFRDDIDNPLYGPFGIGGMGDVLYVGTFGPKQRFDTTSNLFTYSPNAPDGIDGGILGPNVDFTADGFTTQGPLVQGWDGFNTTAGQMIFSFDISGTLTEGMITNVQPLFGTDGAATVPEPTSLFLLGSGLLGLAAFGRGKRKKIS